MRAAIGANAKGKIGKAPAGEVYCSPCDPGSTFEGDMEHIKRHKAQAHKCLRCIYLVHPKRLEECAPLTQPSGQVGTWLQAAPSYKGPWALGCRICAGHRALAGRAWSGQPLAAQAGAPKRKHKKKNIKDPVLRQRGQARFSKFASFAWSRAGAWKQMRQHIEQHGNSQGHQVALRAMAQNEFGLQADSPAHAKVAAPHATDPLAQKTFKGRVPKPVDWLDCFVETSHHVSWRKQAKLRIAKGAQIVEGAEPLASHGQPLATPGEPASQPLAAPRENGQPLGLAGPRETVDNQRKRVRKQTRFIAECVRRKHRRVLRKAQFCTLALDEAQGRKLVHFRCDYHIAPWYYEGTLGIFKSAPKTTQEGEGDHAEKALKRLDEFLNKFCTPLRKKSLGTECDEGLKQHLLKIVTTISADGGSSERRAIYIACQSGVPFLPCHMASFYI